MRKFLVGVILGALVAGNANSSIISRSFLDEALTDYATTTALDLKANQSDFTELNTQISDSVDLLRQLLEQGGYSYEFVNFINPEKFPNTISGAFSLLYQYLDEFAGSIWNGWTDSNGNWFFGLRDITEDYYNNTRADIRKLYDGWDAGNNTSYLGVIGLNDKIGTLPDGLTVQGMYEGWTQDDRYHPGLGVISDYVSRVEDAYSVRFPLVFTQGSPSTKIDGVDYTGPVYPLWKLSEEVDKLTFPEGIDIYGNGAHELFSVHQTSLASLPKTVTEAIHVLLNCNGSPGQSAACLPYMADNILFGNALSNSFIDAYKQQFPGLTRYKGLLKLTSDIGTLPSGNMQPSKGLTLLLPDTEYYTYPTSIGDFMGQMYNGYLGLSGLAEAVYHGNEYTGQTNTVFQVKGLRKITEEIGTLPSGTLIGAGGGIANSLYQRAQQNSTPLYPTSMADFVLQIYGEVGKTGGDRSYAAKRYKLCKEFCKFSKFQSHNSPNHCG